MQVTALAFDAYGTLFDVHGVAARCEAQFPGRGEALGSLWRRKQLEYTWLRSLMGRYRDFLTVTREALAYALAALELTADEGVQQELLEGYMQPAPFAEVPAALDALESYRLAVLSNGTPEMLDAALRHADLERAFAAVLSADAVRRYKPDPAVYALALERFGLPREQIGFVSVNAWDVAGAVAFGYRAIWVNRSGATPETLDLPPALMVGDLGELVQALKGS